MNFLDGNKKGFERFFSNHEWLKAAFADIR